MVSAQAKINLLGYSAKLQLQIDFLNKKFNVHL
jgi:hypothetical protein